MIWLIALFIGQLILGGLRIYLIDFVIEDFIIESQISLNKHDEKLFTLIAFLHFWLFLFHVLSFKTCVSANEERFAGELQHWLKLNLEFEAANLLLENILSLDYFNIGDPGSNAIMILTICEVWWIVAALWCRFIRLG